MTAKIQIKNDKINGFGGIFSPLTSTELRVLCAVQATKVNYIVAWKGKGEENETAVLLPELVLAKFTDDTL